MIRLIEGLVLALILGVSPPKPAKILACPARPDFEIVYNGVAVDSLSALPEAAIRAICIARYAGFDLHNLSLVLYSGRDCVVIEDEYFSLCVSAETHLHGDSATIIVHDVADIGEDGSVLVHEMIHVHRMNEDPETMWTELVVEEGIVIEMTRSTMEHFAHTWFVVGEGVPSL